MDHTADTSDFLRYLIDSNHQDHQGDKLPSLSDLSDELNISVARLREQLEVAKALGFVEVRPRTGMRKLPYDFGMAVWQSLSYAIQVDPKIFELYADLRMKLETSYWINSVKLLQPEDIDDLQQFVASAWKKLRGDPIRIPHIEHRKLHLTMYRRLENPFVIGVLTAYWDGYEAVGLNVFTAYEYLNTVWRYHEKMVDAIVSGNYEDGHRLLVEHFELLYHRPVGE